MGLWEDCTECFDFDNNANAQKDSAHNLTAVDSPTYDGTDKKQGTHSVVLDGDSQYFYLASDDHFNMDAGSYSVSARFKWTGTGRILIFEKFATNYRNGWVFCFFWSDPYGNYYPSLKHANEWSGDQSSEIDLTVSEDTWYHVVGVYNSATGKVVWYMSASTFGDILDGVETSITVTPGNCTDSIYIGYSAVDTFYFSGKQDELAIFKGKVLTRSEAESIFNGSWRSGVQTLKLNPAGRWLSN